MDKKLTLSLDAAVIERAKAYARNRETSLSRMIEQYLASLTVGEGSGVVSTFTPLVERLSGVVDLPEDDDRYRSDYTEYLSEKHR